MPKEIDFATAVIDTTYLCNDNCAFCFNQKFLKNPQTLPLAEMQQKFLRAQKLYKIHQVILTGGEPTLHPEFWEMLDFFYNQTSTLTSLNTNSLRFADAQFSEQVEKFLRVAKNPHRMFSLSLSSVDHFPAKTVKEKLKLQGVKNAIGVAEKTGVHLAVVIIITRANFRILPKLVDFLSQNSSKNLVISLRGLYLGDSMDAAQKQKTIPADFQQVKPFIVQAMEKVLENPRFRIRLFGLPLCYFSDFPLLPKILARREKWYHERRIKIAAGKDFGVRFFQEEVWEMEECKSCALKDKCNRIQREFIEDYAYPRLRPFHKPRLRSVHLIPTYGCNLRCSYCYAAKFKGKFPQMSWLRFCGVVNQLVLNGVERIVFIGGEPTIWRYLDRAIETTRNLGMQVVVLTNATIRMGNLPHAITVNGNNLLDENLQEKILANLKHYRKSGVKIGIRFNLNEQSTFAVLKQYAVFAKVYADEVSISPIVPYVLSKKLGKILYDFAQLIEKNQQKATFSRALPICIFTSAQLKYLREKCGLYSICSPATASIVINPDGTTFPCVDLKIPQKLKQDLNENCVGYNAAIAKLKCTPTFAACAQCRYFRVDCKGGCLAMKCDA